MFNTDNMLRYCVAQIDKGLPRFLDQFPDAASVGEVYPPEEEPCWTQGFWPGMLFLAWQLTNEEKYKDAALHQVELLYDRILKKSYVNHHDMGFLYLPTCVTAWRLCGSETGRKAALLAADNLRGRFQEKGQFLQAWGDLGEKGNYRLIIDCLMNIPLLFWAEKETGDNSYGDAARAHLQTTMRVILREDGSTFHTYFFDPATGAPDHGQTAQGYSDNSIWSRGQAWGIYGAALGYLHTADPSLIDDFRRMTDVFLSHLPENMVPAWDMVFTDTGTQKDTSAAAIAASGILLMAKLCPLEPEYTRKAEEMLEALCRDDRLAPEQDSSGLLRHGVYSLPLSVGVDECNLWGDYFFMEALMRLRDPSWVSCWESGGTQS